jgi:uncharacterized protein
MSVEVRPLGVNCNLSCTYCYQQPQRDAKNFTRGYDMGRMLSTLTAIGRPFTIFGGEPLLAQFDDLEKLFAQGYESHGRVGIQTNGTLITEKHIELFRRYNVYVGISMDGPGRLNDLRWAGALEPTRVATKRSENAIETLCAAGIPVTLILTMHRLNASAGRLPQLLAWLDHLDEIGVKSVRTHVLEVEYDEIRERYALTEEEQLRALIALDGWWTPEKRVRLETFRDIERLLAGQDKGVSCIWRACDPYTTLAVQGVEGDGRQTNCGRVNKEGIDFVKSPTVGYERYVALYHTPQEFGGCSGCRFFAFCKGQCPGTAISGDWRNRSEYCALWKALFERVEGRLIAAGKRPLSKSRSRPLLERELVAAWRRGQNPYIADVLQLISSALPTKADSRG